jgi:hypothetical protein
MAVSYIIFLEEQEAIDLIDQINLCKGWPSEGTNTWMVEPDIMCEFDLQTGDKINIGYGIFINGRVYDCLNSEQKTEVFDLPSNINTCEWEPIV